MISISYVSGNNESSSSIPGESESNSNYRVDLVKDILIFAHVVSIKFVKKTTHLMTFVDRSLAMEIGTLTLFAQMILTNMKNFGQAAMDN